MDPRQAVEHTARDSYARLLAFLVGRTRDVAAAEDALADAFQAALETWPRRGVPRKPEAWLLTAARRRLIDAGRHARVHADAVPTLLALANEAQTLANAKDAFPDQRLNLLFMCAHPAINAAVRTPLMLQTVLGLDAARIAAAFLVPPSTMGQRLSRAKAKIRDAGICFRLPLPEDLGPRFDAVLEAVYAAYGSGWDDAGSADPRRDRLAVEALQLGRLLVRLAPDQPEARGLLALMLYCEARRDARRSATGAYVPLAEQDVTLWSRPMIGEAEQCLQVAAGAGCIGRFQLEAAIQSAHAQRARGRETDWESVALMYEGLVRLSPTIGALVGRAAAVAEARGPESAWTLIQAIPADDVSSYQPYWALAAHVLKRTRRVDEASRAYARAMALCDDPAMRQFLERASRLPLVR